MAAPHSLPSDAVSTQLPEATNDRTIWLKRTIAEASATLIEDMVNIFDRLEEPFSFTSGEAAIAVGWSAIDDLENSVASVNAALQAVNSKTVEVARAHFGDGIANRVRLINETTLDAARYRLEYRISAISRTFEVSGNLVEMDGEGNLCRGVFTLTYDGDDFRALVGTDQHACVTEQEATRLISVREVTANLASGQLVP